MALFIKGDILVQLSGRIIAGRCGNIGRNIIAGIRASPFGPGFPLQVLGSSLTSGLFTAIPDALLPALLSPARSCASLLVNSRAALTVPPLYVGYHSAVVLYGTDGLMNNGAGFPWPNIRRLHGRADPNSVLMLVKGKRKR